MNQPKLKNWVNAKMNDEFISIKTCSGYFNFLADPEVPEHLLAPNAGEEEVGRAVVDALSRSRILIPRENREFFSVEGTNRRYEEWVRKTMERYDYKNRRTMFANMKSCSIHSHEGEIIFGPSNHVELEAWGRNKSDGIEDVVILETSSAVEVGKALKEAFNRCG